MELLLHVVDDRGLPPDGDHWSAGQYRPPSLDEEGFVHCSTPEQILDVAARFYAGRDDLHLLCLDADRLAAEVRYEALGEATEPYPHVYGPVDRDAVVDAVPFPSDGDGFSLPERVTHLSDT